MDDETQKKSIAQAQRDYAQYLKRCERYWELAGYCLPKKKENSDNPPSDNQNVNSSKG